MVKYDDIVLIVVVCCNVQALPFDILNVTQIPDNTNTTEYVGEIENRLYDFTNETISLDKNVSLFNDKSLKLKDVKNVEDYQDTQDNTNITRDVMTAIQLGTQGDAGQFEHLNGVHQKSLTALQTTTLFNNQTSNQNVSNVVEDFAETTLSPELPTPAPGSTKVTAPDVPYVITNTDAHRIILTNDHHPNYRRPFKHHLQLGTYYMVSYQICCNIAYVEVI